MCTASDERGIRRRYIDGLGHQAFAKYADTRVLLGECLALFANNVSMFLFVAKTTM